MDSLKCSDLQEEVTPRNKEMKTDTWEDDGSLHGREKNPSVKYRERSRLLAEQL